MDLKSVEERSQRTVKVSGERKGRGRRKRKGGRRKGKGGIKEGKMGREGGGE